MNSVLQSFLRSARLGRVRRAGGLGLFLVLALALVVSGLTTWRTAAQSPDVDLVSTLDTGVDVVTQSNRQKVVAFITGPNQTGYTLNSITIAFSSDSGQTGTVSLHEGTPTGGASTMPAAVGTFNSPSSISSGLATYTAASPVQLEPSTKYSVSYRDTLTGTDFTPQVNSDFTGQFGFLALRTSWYRTAGSGNFTKTNNTAQRIMYKLNGSVNTTTNEVLVSNKVTSKDHNRAINWGSANLGAQQFTTGTQTAKLLESVVLKLKQGRLSTGIVDPTGMRLSLWSASSGCYPSAFKRACGFHQPDVRDGFRYDLLNLS